jgi:hypothetical protein
MTTTDLWASRKILLGLDICILVIVAHIIMTTPKCVTPELLLVIAFFIGFPGLMVIRGNNPSGDFP